MKKSILLEKLWMEKKEFATSNELKEYCKKLSMEYTAVVHYLSKMKYLVRIFRGIFYVRSVEEIKLGRSRYNHLELVAQGLKLKGVENWYFGLHTSLMLNNMTHEYFTIENVISDSIFRANPIKIAGYKFKFVKLAPTLFDFGIKKEKMLRYSNPEKTILDFIYLSKQEGKGEERIVMDVSEWTENISKEKIRKYVKHYPKTVAKIVDRLIK